MAIFNGAIYAHYLYLKKNHLNSFEYYAKSINPVF